ncbi:MAG: hypothetical protein ACOCYR_04110 [Erythrobacter sp.]
MVKFAMNGLGAGLAAALALAAGLGAPMAAAGDAPRPLEVAWTGSGARPTGLGGMRTCRIQAGQKEPMVNFAVNEYDTDRASKFRMIAPWLDGQPDRAPVAVRIVFPDGSTFEGEGVYGNTNHMTVTSMPSLDTVLAGLSRPGALVVTVGGRTNAFAAPDLAREIADMRACVAALPPAKAP